MREMRRQIGQLQQELSQAYRFDRIVTRDPGMLSLCESVARIASSNATVVIHGESGVGKELLAASLHYNSPRAQKPFVKVNCGAIPEGLLESEFFGHEKGAFTGASTAQPGKFEQAQNGTLLLDEVTEMPLGLQAKLLRVLQEREVERVGGKKAVPLDIRIIATSNRDMAEAVARGVLREDVYYRLNVFPLLIPALRQRPDDIVPLAQHFLAEHGGRAGRPGLCLSPSAEDALRRHPWPGNVRELENVMQRAVIFAAGDAVEAEALHLSVLTTGVLKPAVVEAPVAATPASDAQRTNNMRDLEREHILETLAAVGGSRKLASEKLGMSERTLRHKLKQYREAGLFKE